MHTNEQEYIILKEHFNYMLWLENSSDIYQNV